MNKQLYKLCAAQWPLHSRQRRKWTSAGYSMKLGEERPETVDHWIFNKRAPCGATIVCAPTRALWSVHGVGPGTM